LNRPHFRRQAARKVVQRFQELRRQRRHHAEHPILKAIQSDEINGRTPFGLAFSAAPLCLQSPGSPSAAFRMGRAECRDASLQSGFAQVFSALFGVSAEHSNFAAFQATSCALLITAVEPRTFRDPRKIRGQGTHRWNAGDETIPNFTSPCSAAMDRRKRPALPYAPVETNHSQRAH